MRSTLPRLDRSRVARFLLAAAFASVSLAGLAADIAFKSSHVHVGTHALKVELALTEAEREHGLMFRKSLGRDEGMVFVFDEPAYQSMWMKNTLIPLSVAFLDGDGRILNILDMDPQTLDTHTSAGPARYAIETNIGWFERNKVKAGDRVAGLPPLPR